MNLNCFLPSDQQIDTGHRKPLRGGRHDRSNPPVTLSDLVQSLWSPRGWRVVWLFGSPRRMLSSGVGSVVSLWGGVLRGRPQTLLWQICVTADTLAGILSSHPWFPLAHFTRVPQRKRNYIISSTTTDTAAAGAREDDRCKVRDTDADVSDQQIPFKQKKTKKRSSFVQAANTCVCVLHFLTVYVKIES